MPRLPDKTLLGDPSFNAQRPNASLSTESPNDYATAAAIGGGLSKLGSVAGGIIEEKRKEDDALDLIKAESSYKKGLIESEQSFDNDPDYDTFGQRHAQTSRELMDSSASIIRNPNVRSKWLAKADLEGEQSYNRVLDKGLKLQKEAKIVEVDDVLKGYRARYVDPNADDDTRAQVLRDMDATLGVAQRTGLLTPLHAKALRDKHIEGAYADDAEARMWQDPYGLLKDLQTVPGGNKALATDTLSFIKNVEGSKDNGWDVRQYSGPYGVKRGRDERLTPEQAEERLKGEVADVQATLDSKIKVPLSDNQRTALTSLFYNIGTDKGRVDQVADLINSGDIDKVPGWIKQYTRDRDGKYVPGLASRRAKEADLFAQAPAEDMAEGVTRSDLPSVEDVQRSNRYAGLSPERRRALITRTKIALSSVSQGEIKDDIERMLRGEEPEVGEDGLTSMERASKVLQPNQVKKFQQAWDDARLTRDAMVPMAGMGPVERQQHLASIDPDRPENKERLGASYRAAVKAQQRAERLDKAMSVLESQDPVEAVDPHRENEMRKAGLAKRASEVSNTYEMLRARNPNVRIDDDGTVTPLSPDAEDAARNVRVKILDARIDAQNERGIPDYASRTISKIEAKELLQLPDDVNKLTPKELREALTDAQTRVTNLYGPYAGTVMKDAIDLHIKKAPDADRKPIVERAVREAGRGAQTWTAIERDQRMKAADDQYPIVPYDQVQRLDKIESTLNPDVPVVPPAKPAKTRDWTKMSPDSQKRATDVLMQSFAKDPDAAQLFDRYFGQPGLAAKILKQGVPQP